MKSKYIKCIWFGYMYGASEKRLWNKYWSYIGRRRFNVLLKDCLYDHRNLYMA